MKLLRFHLWGLFWAGALQEVCRFVLFSSLFLHNVLLSMSQRNKQRPQERMRKRNLKKFKDGE